MSHSDEVVGEVIVFIDDNEQFEICVISVIEGVSQRVNTWFFIM
jgi:hypothetical protein